MARYTMDSFDELRRMQERMAKLFEELPDTLGSLAPGMGTTRTPYVDIMSRDNDIVVTADLPGIDKDDIKISVTGDTLEIRAERKIEQEQKKQGYVRRERGFNRYYRAIRLPAAVDKNKAKAKFNNGVLEVTLPRIKKAEAGNIPVS